METLTDSNFTIIDLPAYPSRLAMNYMLKDYSNKIDTIGHDYVLDMKNVTNIFSTTARLIITIYKATVSFQSNLYIVNVSSAVENALKAIHFTDKIPVYKTMFDFEFNYGSIKKSA